MFPFQINFKQNFNCSLYKTSLLKRKFFYLSSSYDLIINFSV
jgi:hypothetical protein